MQNKKLEEGQKYLSLRIGDLKLVLFPNQNKTKPEQPDFVGSLPLACWVSKKKGVEPEVKIEEVL